VPGFGAESITEGTIMEFKKNVGDGVTKGEVICIIETDKVTVEVNAAESGKVTEIIANVDDTVEVGATLLKIEVGDAPAAGASPAEAPAVSAPASAPVPTESIESIPAYGFKAGLLRAKAIREGKVTPAPAAAAPVAPSAPEATTTTIAATGRGDRRVPMNLVRKIVAKRLKDAQNTAALLTTFQEVDMTEVMNVQSKYKDLFQKTHGAQLGYLSMFAKASALALGEEPGVNGVIDDGTGEIVYRDYSDISVPIPSPRGIVSCTLSDCHQKSLKDMEVEIANLMSKARKDELALTDMSSPTFGITDSGTSGGMLGTTIINPPTSAIMGTNAVTQRAAVVNGKVVARPIMYISLTYDHRLIDGREAVTFLVNVRDKLEDPVRMLLDL
jgi:2-oxoglutarate dehydrogenase E2 component (dihydrolipoamide succinyltransferase)